MIDGGVSFFSVFSVFFIISLGVIIILWILMPYSVFKSREILEDIKKEQEKTNKLLEGLSLNADRASVESPDKQDKTVEDENTETDK